MNASKLCDLLERAVADEMNIVGGGLTGDYRTLYFTVIGDEGKMIVVSVQYEDGSTI